jgi:predicted transcriptional regulator
MTAQESFRPTDSELEILNVLWQFGPCTVRQVHEELKRSVGYTTVLKLLQIMTVKELVVRDETQRSHVYRARHKQDQMQRRLVRDLMERAFSGAADKLVQQAISARGLSPKELVEIRKLLDDMEGKQK